MMRFRGGRAAIAVLALVAGSAVALAGAQVTKGAGDPVIAGAGDIAESGQATMANAKSTGDLIREINPTFALALGDNAYNDGTIADYQTKYDPTWGSFKAITKPVPGNHEWHDSGEGYYDYFFGGAPTPWYAYDIGNGWRGYALNCEVSCGRGSAQELWFKADLAAHPGMHYVAYAHEPRYTSGTEHSDATELTDLYEDLVAAGGDIWLAGHNHTYERFAKMDGRSALNPKGVRTFVVGTGGNQLYALERSPHVGEQFRQNTDYGVLKLTLHAASYSWEFIASGRGYVDGAHVDTGRKGQVLDSGTEATNNPAGATTTSSPTTSTTLGTPTSAGSTTTTAAPSGGVLPSYIINSHSPDAAAQGFNLMDVSPSSLPDLPAGTQGIVWLGDIGSDCRWERSDAEVRSFVDEHRGDAAVFAYNIADEPDDSGCAAAPAMLRARTDLIHSIDPAARTFAIITEPDLFGQYAPTVDIPAIDPYPCRAGAACDLSTITNYVTALEQAIGDRPWWGVIQAF
jgi:hypothetical protein